MLLKETFYQLHQSFNVNYTQTEASWQSIEQAYSHSTRHYHNLTHLSNLLAEIEPIQSQFTNYPAILFALYYHDFVYDVLQKENEAQSAQIAVQELLQLLIPEELIAICEQCILATVTHQAHRNLDINYFLDADIAVLGCSENTYKQYAIKVRREYAVYPDEVYGPGRKHVLLHFLSEPQIYKTTYFKDKYEGQARINLSNELASL